MEDEGESRLQVHDATTEEKDTQSCLAADMSSRGHVPSLRARERAVGVPAGRPRLPAEVDVQARLHARRRLDQNRLRLLFFSINSCVAQGRSSNSIPTVMMCCSNGSAAVNEPSPLRCRG